VFERFSDRARRVVVLAQDEARDLGHDYIGTEHLLLGLLHDSAGAACEVLSKLKITPDAVRDKVGEQVTPGDVKLRGHVPFTAPAKKSLEFSLREAMKLGHNYIGSGHLLLGLIREERGTAATVLAALGVDLDRARSLVAESQENPKPQPGSRGFTAGPFNEINDRLRSIEGRMTAIESRLGNIEDRLA
jgi:ATP-dependent Clp protease ATP-binding subunit ClpC